MMTVVNGKVRAAYSASDPTALVCASVDETIFRLLDAIDNAVIELQWVERAPSGPVARELAGSSSDDLARWYIGEDGWRQAYSQQPVFPP